MIRHASLKIGTNNDTKTKNVSSTLCTEARSAICQHGRRTKPRGEKDGQPLRRSARRDKDRETKSMGDSEFSERSVRNRAATAAKPENPQIVSIASNFVVSHDGRISITIFETRHYHHHVPRFPRFSTSTRYRSARLPRMIAHVIYNSNERIRGTTYKRARGRTSMSRRHFGSTRLVSSHRIQDVGDHVAAEKATFFIASRGTPGTDKMIGRKLYLHFFPIFQTEFDHS